MTPNHSQFDPDRQRYQPGLERELRDCLRQLEYNQNWFDLETEPELIEQRIYEREALRCRYRYLLRRARDLVVRAVV